LLQYIVCHDLVLEFQTHIIQDFLLYGVKYWIGQVPRVAEMVTYDRTCVNI
jgi:hypothetical protein